MIGFPRQEARGVYTAASEVWQSRLDKHPPCQKMGLNHSYHHCPQIDGELSALHCVCCEGCESRKSVSSLAVDDVQKTTWMEAEVRGRKEGEREAVGTTQQRQNSPTTLGLFLAFSFLYIT